MADRNTVFHILEEMAESPMLEHIKVGFAGSFARGEQVETSDIDIILETDKINKSSDMLLLEYMSGFLDLNLPIRYDLLWMHLLKEEDKELDSFCERFGIGNNTDSVYKNICKDVIWLNRE